MNPNNNYDIIRSYNENAKFDIIKSNFEKFLCAYCQKIAIDIYSTVCGCRYCKICVYTKLDVGSSHCDGMVTAECKEIKLTDSNDFIKDELADRKLSEKKIDCYICEAFQDKLKNMSVHFTNCQEELFQKEMEKGNNKLIKMKLVDYERKFEEIYNKINDLSENFTIKCSKEMLDLQEKIVNLEMTVAEYKPKLIELNRVTEILTDRLQNYELDLGNLEMSTGMSTKDYFLWKIEGVARQLVVNEKLHSKSFYTRDLYKMRLVLHMNGDGIGNVGYISIYFQICKGNYDDIIPWPCQSNIKFELMNIADPSQTKSSIINFKAQNINFYNRPQTECNVGYGYLKFVSNTNIVQEHVANDAIFLKFYPNVGNKQ